MTEGATAAPLVRAAGGVVWRGLAPEVVVVHRPKYDDWSLPKGKCDDGESDVDAALREVEEETGLRCAIGTELGESRYTDHKGRPKVVRWWAMTPLEGGFSPHDEVDELRWVAIDGARRLLSYERDRSVLDAFVDAVGPAAVPPDHG